MARKNKKPSPAPDASTSAPAQAPAEAGDTDAARAGLVELPGETIQPPAETIVATSETVAAVSETIAAAPKRFRVSLPGQPSGVVEADDEGGAVAAYCQANGIIATDHRPHVEPWDQD